MERRINIGKKTIQMSNFHNAPETKNNSTGRKQITIQSGCCLFFDGKTAHYLLEKILNRTKYGLIFQKSETGVFLLKMILNETRNIAVDGFERGKVFYFTRNRM